MKPMFYVCVLISKGEGNLSKYIIDVHFGYLFHLTSGVRIF